MTFGQQLVVARSYARGPVTRILAPHFVDATEDVLQEASIRAFKHRHKFRGDAKFSTWFYRIAINNALMYRRSQLSRKPMGLNTTSLTPIVKTFSDDGEDATNKGNIEEWLISPRPSPEEQLLAQEQRQVLGRLITRLPPTQRVAILRYSQGERGERIQCSTEKARRFRARQKLRLELSMQGVTR